jgi:hypothetical protein
MNVQVPFVQAASAWSTSGHFALQALQWLTLVSVETHSFPQSVGASGAQPVEHWKPAPAGAHTGVAAGHTALHAPQLVAFDRSTSQPSTGSWLQSA